MNEEAPKDPTLDATTVSPAADKFGSPSFDDTNKPVVQPNTVVHTAAPGETLAYIASLYYPDVEITPRIIKGLWAANVNRVRDVDALTVGTNIIIPVFDPDWNDDDYWEVKDVKRAEAYWNNKLNTPPAL